MELLLLKYGYLLLFAGVIVEGEAVLIAGSFLASRGYFNIGTVALVALAANTLSAQFYYTAARVRGRRWFEGRFPEKSSYRKSSIGSEPAKTGCCLSADSWLVSGSSSLLLVVRLECLSRASP